MEIVERGFCSFRRDRGSPVREELALEPFDFRVAYRWRIRNP
jgi:hypothetical protein